MTVALRSARGRGVLLATVLGSGVAFLDSTVVNVALPVLGRELHAGIAGLQWTVDAYLLTLTALLLLGGSLGDALGRGKMFVAGLAWFALASAACGLAPSIEALIAARAVQGAGAALLVPGSLAVLRDSFAEDEQGQAIGAWAGLSGVTTALGPLLGGWLITAWSWRVIFFLNLPLAAAAAWAALRCVPDSRPSGPARIDMAGAAAATLELGGCVYALIEAPAHGPGVAAAAALGAACLAAFLWILRNEAIRAPNQDLDSLADLDERIDAHLDGLRVAGAHGWETCVDQLAWREAGEVFAAAYIALQGRIGRRLDVVLDVASESIELSRGFVGALAWLPYSDVERTVASFLNSDDRIVRRIGLAASAAHRRDPGVALGIAALDSDLSLRARALKAAAELGRRDLLPLCSPRLLR